jgi:hypothetical protein
MNKFLSPAFATVLTLVATVGFAQPRTAYSGFTPVNHGQGSVGSTVSSNARSASVSRTTMGSNMGHTQLGSAASADALITQRRYHQAQYVATAVVMPLTQDLRGTTEREFRTAAPTKAAAMSRMRDIIRDIGVPVRVISLDIVRH